MEFIAKIKKHLIFIKNVFPTRKTPIYDVCNQDYEQLGRIYWYTHWRQYVFEPHKSNNDYVFSWDCLHEITRFLIDLKVETKIK